MRQHMGVGACLGVLIGFGAAAAWGADGAIEINAARAAAGGVTPTDAPGFPVTIDQPGVYVLTSDLTVSTVSTGAIRIDVSDVTLDLMGHTIAGPSVCTGSGATQSCSPADNFPGVLALSSPDALRTVVRNGRVRGFGRGLDLRNECRVERLAETESSASAPLS